MAGRVTVLKRLRTSRVRRWLLLATAVVLASTPLHAAAVPPAHEVEHVSIPSHDGVVLDGWIVRPAGVSADQKLPIVLWSAPYFGRGLLTGDNPALYDNSSSGEAVPVNFLVEHGYAVAIVNVRGTGNSGGCFTWFGKDEQQDQAFLVEWLADQPWSNGSVGMVGLSYHGTTPWEAAIENPPALKTIVTAGIVSDPYLFSHTPQGATFMQMAMGYWHTNFTLDTSIVPPTSGNTEHTTVGHAPVVPERVCPDVARLWAEDAKGTHTDVRDKAFWDERRLIDKFPGVTTSVLLVDGFQDNYWSGHQLQANEVWNLLPNAPKQMLVGQWGHSFPNYNTYNRNWAMADWNDRLLTWLDYWLKGIGSEPAGLGTVEYQEGLYEDQPSVFSSSLPGPAPSFQTTTAWPPPAAKAELLYLSNGKLTGSPQDGSASFRSYNNPDAHQDPQDLLCPRGIVEVAPASVTFVSEPVRKPVAVAGNPFAYLKLSSDLPGGLVAVNLFDLAPEFACGSETPTGVKMWSTGAADLRFHKGNFTGEPFPVGTPTHVRVDLTDFAERLEPGHRLAVVLSRGDTWDRMGTPVHQPGITVHADGGSQASHLVLPVVQGKLGGRPAKLDYPPRPFLPALAR